MTNRCKAEKRTAILLMAFALTMAPALAVGNEADFKAALAASQKAIDEASALKNQWTTTEQALKQAKAAAVFGDFDKATTLAKHAEELAKASIYQAKEQASNWREADVR